MGQRIPSEVHAHPRTPWNQEYLSIIQFLLGGRRKNFVRSKNKRCTLEVRKRYPLLLSKFLIKIEQSCLFLKNPNLLISPLVPLFLYLYVLPSFLCTVLTPGLPPRRGVGTSTHFCTSWRNPSPEVTRNAVGLLSYFDDRDPSLEQQNVVLFHSSSGPLSSRRPSRHPPEDPEQEFNPTSQAGLRRSSDYPYPRTMEYTRGLETRREVSRTPRPTLRLLSLTMQK